MTKYEDPSPLLGDIEKPHPTVVDKLGDESDGRPVPVRLGDLWSDFIRLADKARDSEAVRKPGSVLPLLDEMKGILQWD